MSTATLPAAAVGQRCQLPAAAHIAQDVGRQDAFQRLRLVVPAEVLGAFRCAADGLGAPLGSVLASVALRDLPHRPRWGGWQTGCEVHQDGSRSLVDVLWPRQAVRGLADSGDRPSQAAVERLVDQYQHLRAGASLDLAPTAYQDWRGVLRTTTPEACGAFIPRGYDAQLPDAATLQTAWMPSLPDGLVPVRLPDPQRYALRMRGGVPEYLLVQSGAGPGVGFPEGSLLAETLSHAIAAPVEVGRAIPFGSGWGVPVCLARGDRAWQDAFARHVLQAPGDTVVCLTRWADPRDGGLVAWAPVARDGGSAGGITIADIQMRRME